ncbi:unnamed protein product [Rotaria sp. Silwood1]|nr:unnamed protein product [Rotaria sp. Silwood1]
MNPYCGLCIRNCTFGVQLDELQQLLRCDLRCSGRPICPFRCSVIIRNDGTGHIIVSNNNVRHKQNSRICRPIRTPLRSIIKQQFNVGASVYRMYQNRLQARSIEERQGRNYDATGKSRAILQKIKSEAVTESLISPDADDGLLKLNEQYRNEVHAGGKVPGVIQSISKYPCQVIVFSESSIRLYDALLKHKNIVVSWDATGSIIKQNNSLQLLYYELSMTLPGVVTQDSIIPITFMISDAHALVNVLHWMQMFRHSYSKVFPGQDFPRPNIVLSDRAQVFLTAALQIWNSETTSQFLHRAYRIVTNEASEIDYKLTNIHACLSHVLLAVRKMVNKLLDEKIRNLAMWCIALLINTSTWKEMMHNWKLICFALLQMHIGGETLNVEYQDALLDKITKIRADPNVCAIMQSTEPEPSNTTANYNQFDYDDIDDDQEQNEQFSTYISQTTPSRKKNGSTFIDEEAETNATDSPFKSILNNIFDDCLKDIGISIDEARKPARHGILRWFKYLTTSLLPTIPIWSNLLIGDLSRHRQRLVRSFECLMIQEPEQRTTANSERRMGILKRAQLETQLKPIEEHWRKSSNRRNCGRYTKAPDDFIITELMSSLIAPTNNVNANLVLPVVTPSWLNTAICMLLSTQTYGMYYNCPPILPTNIPIILDLIRTFLDDWCKSTTRTNQMSKVTFNLPNTDQPKEPNEQSMYILENILIPLLHCNIIGYKVYVCHSCKSETKVRVIITHIPVNISKTGLYIEHELLTFFGPMTSDVLCSACGKSTVRHIEVIQWPQVLIINITDPKATFRYRRPPAVISVSEFSHWIAIGAPSSTLYDLITFNSVLGVGDKNVMIRVTKTKKNWTTSVNKKIIGNGEQLRRLYGSSRILIFERIFHQTKFNMVYAIARCSSDASSLEFPDVSISLTLQEACQIIETNSDLNELKETLISDISTYFYCPLCRQTPNSLVSSHHQIFIFKLTVNNQLVAHRVISKDNDDLTDDERSCENCKYSIKNIDLPVYKQIFHKCPIVLLKFVNRDVPPENVFQSQIKLIDSSGQLITYKATAILIISRYSNVPTAAPPSSMKILSRDTVNGTERITVQDGEKVFLVTCGPRTNK